METSELSIESANETLKETVENELKTWETDDLHHLRSSINFINKAHTYSTLVDCIDAGQSFYDADRLDMQRTLSMAKAKSEFFDIPLDEFMETLDQELKDRRLKSYLKDTHTDALEKIERIFKEAHRYIQSPTLKTATEAAHPGLGTMLAEKMYYIATHNGAELADVPLPRFLKIIRKVIDEQNEARTVDNGEGI
ncbi:MAG: hypothetical protein V4526_00665 [Patescibacteria group bacterium]